jgi:predicted DsbA family dithiol-disulfide isomerase|tara:strand:- start:34 stop:1077 length:1044 start_codon:yes stop_codon:yes gene_type:complete
MKFKFYFLFFSILFFSCKTKKSKPHIQSGVAFTIDSKAYSYKDVDTTVRQELFDELNRIYSIRKIAIDFMIQKEILKIEAKAKNISTDDLLDSLYENKATDANVIKYIKKNDYTEGIPLLEKGYSTFSIKSEKGKRILLERFKKTILLEYVDSLKSVHKINFYIKPPASPFIKIENLMTYYKGNLDSKVTFLQISDLECEMCREYAPIFNELYQKYKDSVRFGFTQFGSYTSLSARALESSGRQGKFWEMYDSIAFTKYLPEKTDLLKVAKNINLNLEQFNTDLESENIKTALEDNFSKLNTAGIYGTPTIMINNKLIYNSSSIKDIEKMLIEEIKKSTTANTVYKK